MGIFTRDRRPQQPAPAAPPAHDGNRALHLADSIAHSQARLLLVADRIAAGRAEPGDEARLRIQSELTASFRRSLEKAAVPTGLGDDIEEWLRTRTTPSGADVRQLRPH
jgi:hypothetical protein